MLEDAYPEEFWSFFENPSSGLRTVSCDSGSLEDCIQNQFEEKPPLPKLDFLEKGSILSRNPDLLEFILAKVKYYRGILLKIEQERTLDSLRRVNLTYIFLTCNTGDDLLNIIQNTKISEETILGKVMEEIAIEVAKITFGDGVTTPSVPGLDVIILTQDIRYIIQIKSSAFWGNTSSQKGQINFFDNIKASYTDSDKVNTKSMMLITQPHRDGALSNPTKADIQLTGWEAWQFLGQDRFLFRDLLSLFKEESDIFSARLKLQKAETRQKLKDELVSLGIITGHGLLDWSSLLQYFGDFI